MTSIIKQQYSSRINPGKKSNRIEQEHIERYSFACRFAEGKRILDIACGTGYGSSMLKNSNATSVCGVDISPDALLIAKRNYLADGISFIQADIEKESNLGLFDLIVSFETIEHINDCESTLRNFYNMLEPKGRLIISTPNRTLTSPGKSLGDIPNNQYHVREWNLPEFVEVIRKSGFKLEKSDIYGQSGQKEFKNPLIRKLNKKLGWFDDKNFSAKVRLEKDLPNLMYIILIASK